MEDYENDRPDGALPKTLVALTGGGGRHLFFKYPETGTVSGRNPWMKGVDIKSDGGYVILAGGTHISGGAYRWLDLWVDLPDPGQAPPDLILSINSGGSGGQGENELPDTDSLLAEGIPEGKRDDFIHRAASRWRRQLGDNAKEAVKILVLDLAAKCNPPFPKDEALKKVEQAWKHDHTDPPSEWGYVSDDGKFKLHNLTDLGNRNRLVDAYGSNLSYVPEWGWLEWTAIGWQRVGTERMFQFAALVPEIVRNEATVITDTNTQTRWRKHATNSESAGALAAMVKLSGSDERVLQKVDSFDADLNALGCRNGMVDLKTGHIREFQHDDFLTKNTDVFYDPEFRLPQWEKFLDVATEGDETMKDYLQRAAGYTLTGLTSEECFFILSGPTASGKSTFLDALMAAMGRYGTITQSDTFMYRKNKETARDEMATLAGMRLVSMSEIGEGAVFNVPLINQVTGGDRIKAKMLYKDPFEFRPQFKLWIATNHDPASQDEALMRRIKRIPFSHTIPEHLRDPDLKHMLKDPEIGGRAVLAWAVRGAIKWSADRLPEPDKVKLAVDEYRAENDAFGRFLDDCVVIVPDESEATASKVLYQTYDAWAKSNNEFRMRRPQFHQKMKERGFTKTATDLFLGVRGKVMIFGENGVEWQ